MKSLSLFLLFLTSSLALGADPKEVMDTASERNAARASLLLIAGMQKTVDLHFDPCGNVLECIRVANKALAEIQYSKEKHQLIFTPVKAGESTVTIRDAKGDVKLILDIIVSNVNLFRRHDELRELLKDSKGISVRIMSDRLVLDGEIGSLEDLKRLQTVVREPEYKDITAIFTKLKKGLADKIAANLQSQLGASGVTVKAWNDAFILSGKAKSSADADRLVSLARKLVLALGLQPEAVEKLVISKLTFPTND